MLAFIFILFSETATAASGGFSEFWKTYMNYPGFQAWKFINLAIFIGLIVYFVKKPLSDSFKAKREQIRAELIQAEADKQAALAKLTETEAKLAGLEAEKKKVLVRAKDEASAEEKRIAEETEREVSKLRDQAENEISRSTTQAKLNLRRLSAEETVRLAEEMLKKSIGKSNDADIVKSGIKSLGGAK